jgi:predicted unusual protein kinase regulating ubiquinone biosynthesis (AarF/ABC1/UbiB family)
MVGAFAITPRFLIQFEHLLIYILFFFPDCYFLLDYQYTLRGLEGEALEEAKTQCHQRGADRLLKLCMKNGGIYIKLGQVRRKKKKKKNAPRLCLMY